MFPVRCSPLAVPKYLQPNAFHGDCVVLQKPIPLSQVLTLSAFKEIRGSRDRILEGKNLWAVWIGGSDLGEIKVCSKFHWSTNESVAAIKIVRGQITEVSTINRAELALDLHTDSPSNLAVFLSDVFNLKTPPETEIRARAKKYDDFTRIPVSHFEKSSIDRNALEALGPSAVFVPMDRAAVVSNEESRFIYSFGAAPCYILVLSGQNNSGQHIVGLTHIDQADPKQVSRGMLSQMQAKGVSIDSIEVRLYGGWQKMSESRIADAVDWIKSFGLKLVETDVLKPFGSKGVGVAVSLETGDVYDLNPVLVPASKVDRNSSDVAR